MRSSIWRTNLSLPSSTEFYYYYLISFISIHFNTFFFALNQVFTDAIFDLVHQTVVTEFYRVYFFLFPFGFSFPWRQKTLEQFNKGNGWNEGAGVPEADWSVNAVSFFSFFFFGFSLFCFLYFPLERTDFLGRSYFLVSFGLAPFAVLFRALRIVFGDDLMIFSSADSIKRPKNSVKLGQTRYQRETIQENQTKLWKTR